MALDTIGLGTTANDGTGDDARTAGGKINALINFINDRGLTGEGAFPLKPTVRAATTANITLSAPQTIDGVSCIAGDRVLVKDQSSGSANGIYVVAAGAWTRATDFDSWDEIHGAVVVVEEGSVNADRAYLCTNNDGGTLGSTAIAFALMGVASLTSAIWGYLAGMSAFMGGLLATASATALLTATGAAPGHNAIINGDFSIAQRGTTFTSTSAPANNDDTYLLDRWTLLSDGNDIVDVTQNTTAAQLPSGAITGISLDVETANKKFGIIQFIERANCGHLLGGNATLTFKAKKRSGNATVDTLRAAILTWSSTADTLTSDVVSAWNSEGTDPTLIANWTYENVPSNLTLTNSYQTFTITAAVDTASGANVAIFVWCDNGDATVADFIDITDVKLESGSVASAYLPRQRGEELRLCQRYYEKSFAYETVPAQNVGTTLGAMLGSSIAASASVQLYVPFLVAKRPGVAAPTITTYNPSAANAEMRDVVAGADCASTATGQKGDRAFRVGAVTPGGSTGGNLVACHWTADYEL